MPLVDPLPALVSRQPRHALSQHTVLPSRFQRGQGPPAVCLLCPRQARAGLSSSCSPERWGGQRVRLALCSVPTAHPPQPPLAPGERSLSPRRRAGARVLWPIPSRSESLPPRLQRRPRGNAQRCAEEHQAPRMPLRDFGRARRARHGWSAAPDPPALQRQSSGEWWHWPCQDTGHPK